MNIDFLPTFLFICIKSFVEADVLLKKNLKHWQKKETLGSLKSRFLKKLSIHENFYPIVMESCQYNVYRVGNIDPVSKQKSI